MGRRRRPAFWCHDASPLGAVDLDLYADTAVEGGQASPHRDAARPFRFTLSAPSDVSARRYELAAASERELQKWVGEIASARPSAIEQAMVAAAEATMGMQDRHAEETDELCAQVASSPARACPRCTHFRPSFAQRFMTAVTAACEPIVAT